MARLPRIDVPGVPQHLIARGTDCMEIFHGDGDRCIYLQFLEQALEASGCKLHAYVLMSNHVHLLATGHEPGAISELMHRVGGKFARLMNIRWGRTGAFFQGRFHSSLVDSEAYLLTCMRYIELNPVRAGIVRHAKEYGWSSYRDNAKGDPGGILAPHELYARLGRTPAERGATYRDLVKAGVTEEDLTRIRTSAAKGRVLGRESFRKQVEEALDRSVEPRPQGRPKSPGKDREEATIPKTRPSPFPKKEAASKFRLSPFPEPVEDLAVPEA